MSSAIVCANCFMLKLVENYFLALMITWHFPEAGVISLRDLKIVRCDAPFFSHYYLLWVVGCVCVCVLVLKIQSNLSILQWWCKNERVRHIFRAIEKEKKNAFCLNEATTLTQLCPWHYINSYLFSSHAHTHTEIEKRFPNVLHTSIKCIIK